MSRVTGVPINFLFKRGQQIKVISQILRKIKNLDLVIPTEMSRGKPGDIGFQGAYVLNPKQGFYK
jgi:DNA polymerase delta subunit 1